MNSNKTNFNVRFAPSPTGFLHIGGARTALFNYLFAKKNNGNFLLRIEDTDQKRSTKEAIDAIIDGLNWLGLKNDEEIIFQSQNSNRHKEVAQKLLDQGLAYYCYTSSDELAKKRAEFAQENKVFRFKSPWRDKIGQVDDNVKPVVRIKAPKSSEIIIDDLVQGQVRVKNEEIDDFVILRSDGSPTYMLAVVVDDYDMNISHIIRGDDHLNNSFKQKLIYDLLGWQCPKFAHIPLIHGVDGAKMSKRHGATSVVDYKNMGYLPQAMRNYLLRLGFGDGNLDIIDDKKAIEIFDLAKVGKAPSRFDFAKLNNLNKHYLINENDENLWQELQPFITKDLNEIEISRLKRSINFVKQRCNNLVELAKNLEIYYDDYVGELDEKSQNILQKSSEMIVQLKSLIADIKDFNAQNIADKINLWAQENDLKMRDFGPVLRVILTYSAKSAGGVFEIMEIFGQKEVLRRFG